MIEVRAVREGEGGRLRELRLRALDDAPRAYFHSRDSEAALPDGYWESWACDPSKVMFVAVEDGRWLGMAGARLRADGSGTLDATGMWVAPDARGRCIGERLVDALLAWGRARNATRMEFAVTEDNQVAVALYRRLGFTPTGKRRHLESWPGLTGFFMHKPL